MPREYTTADACEDIADIREGIADIREDLMALHTGICDVTQMVQRLEDKAAGVQRDIDDLWGCVDVMKHIFSACIIILGINMLCISLWVDINYMKAT